MPRDDFTETTKSKLAKAVGYWCSNPDCQRVTVGSNSDHSGVINVGVACHITAASIGGPRYDDSIGADIRSDYSNGIWLCQTCSKLIDSDEKFFTVEQLRKWKRDAQDRAFQAVLQQKGDVHPIAGSMPQPPDALLINRIRRAATKDIAGFKGFLEWPQYAVELKLTLYGKQEIAPFTISRLPDGLELQPEISVIAPPGTGKTTTLLQLADAFLTSYGGLPVYIRLSELSLTNGEILSSVSARRRFSEEQITEQNLKEYAADGQLVLLLDGWNEIESAQKTPVRNALKILQRDYPRLRIIVSTRQQALDVPITGPQVEIAGLSEEQQKEYAEKNYGAAGIAVVDRAWRNPGIREMIRIPLYLKTLLESRTDGTLPTTKDELLALFIDKHEKDGEHASVLQDKLYGRQKEFLVGIALEAMRTESTSVSEDQACRSISETKAFLSKNGLPCPTMQQNEILDVLAAHHLIVRNPDAKRIFFQHQQFQEWYASLEVERLMQESFAGNACALEILRKDILNKTSWEEAIFFSCERASRSGPDGAKYVGNAIRITLHAVDPMLAAEMIYRAAPAVWQNIKQDVLDYVQNWHSAGQIDRAFRFMLISGREEFAEEVWPLISSTNEQTSLRALRKAPRFRPSVLGGDIATHIKTLPEKAREIILDEIASHSGADGMDLATELAKTDPSAEVQASVISALHFRRGDRHIEDLLNSAHEETLMLLVQKGYLDEIGNDAQREKLKALRQQQVENETPGPQSLGRLLRDAPTDVTKQKISALIADPRFPFTDTNAAWGLHEAFKKYPTIIASEYLRRLEAKSALPYHTEEVLSVLPPLDSGPIAEMALDKVVEEKFGVLAATVIGPDTTAKLIQLYLEINREARKTKDQNLWRLSHSIKQRIYQTRPTSFLPAFLQNSGNTGPDDIADLAELSAYHGHNGGYPDVLKLDEATALPLVKTLHDWGVIVLASSGGKRKHLYSVAQAMGRIARPELLPDIKCLFDEDYAKWKRSQEAATAARQRGTPIIIEERTGPPQYRQVLSRFPTKEGVALIATYLRDPHVGSDMAFALKDIWDQQQNATKPEWNKPIPDFSGVKDARAARQNERGQTDSIPAAIFNAIQDLLAQPRTPQNEALAIALGRAAFLLPHTDKAEIKDQLLGTSSPILSKRYFLITLVVSGYVLDADLVLSGIQEWLAEAQNKQWMIQRHMFELEAWLALLPYSDRPEASLDGASLAAPVIPKWTYIEKFIAAVGYAPSEQAAPALAQLAKQYFQLARSDDWVHAFLSLPPQLGIPLLLDLLKEDVPLIEDRGFGQIWLTDRLVSLMKADAALKAEILRRYKEEPSNKSTRLIEQALSKLGDEDFVGELIQKYCTNSRRFDVLMDTALEKTVLSQQPVNGQTNAFEIQPVAQTDLRKRLLALLGGTEHESQLAKDCLNAIDNLRDEYGIPPTEPRHPDIDANKPWPLYDVALDKDLMKALFGWERQEAQAETTEAKAFRLLRVIYDQTQGAEPPVIVTDVASMAGLSAGEAQSAWSYLADKHLIKTYSNQYSAKINAQGIDAIERQAQSQPQQISIIQNTINVQSVINSTIQQGGADAVLAVNKKE